MLERISYRSVSQAAELSGLRSVIGLRSLETQTAYEEQANLVRENRRCGAEHHECSARAVLYT